MIFPAGRQAMSGRWIGLWQAAPIHARAHHSYSSTSHLELAVRAVLVNVGAEGLLACQLVLALLLD
jgi:hypothetical protein